MHPQVLLSFVVLTAVGPVSGNSEVTESSAVYSCCGSPALKFDQSCENTWTTYNKTIADSKSKRCISPCKKIEDGLMTLDACVAINATTVCAITMGVIEEKKVCYYSQQCAAAVPIGAAPGNQGSVGLLLLAVVIPGWYVKQVIG